MITKKMLLVCLVIAFVCIALLFGTIMFLLFRSPRKTRDHVQVVVVDTKTSSKTQEPPVYPKDAPQYPLRHLPQEFQQVGVLSRKDEDDDDDPTLLALFGRKMTHRDRWEYYVASDKFHMWKLPVQVKKRVCDDEFGCDEIYNGDEVIVPDYGDRVFIARIYKYAKPIA